MRARSGPAPKSGFLGDYSQLRKGRVAQEIWIKPDVNWATYDSLQIDSVTLWVNKDMGLASDQEKQMLTDVVFRGAP